MGNDNNKELTTEEISTIENDLAKIKSHKRDSILDCFKIVETVFQEQHVTLLKRSQEEQNILGNCITVLESDIKNQMKKLL